MHGQRIKVLFFFFFITVFNSLYSYAQQVKTFQKSYGGSGSDVSMGMLPLADKGFIIAGRTESGGAGGTDILVIRTDSLGKVVWSKTFGGSADEVYTMSLFGALEIIQTHDSNFVIATGTKSYGSGNGDFYLVKFDKDGNVKWTRTFGGTGNEIAYSLTNTPDSGFMVVGMTKSYGTGGEDVLVVRTDDSGKVVWSKTYGTTGDEAAYYITRAQDGNYLITGCGILISTWSSQKYDYYVLKITPSGALVWSKMYGGGEYDLPHDIDELSDGSIYVSGSTYSNAFGGGSGSSADVDHYMLKLDSSGSALWGRHVGNQQREGGRKLYYNKYGYFDWIGGGGGYGPGNPQSVFYTRIDTSGKVKSTKTYGTTGTHYLGYGNLFHRSKNDDLYILGTTDGFGAGSNDFYFIHMDSSGNTNNCKVESQSPSEKSRIFKSISHTTTVKSVTVSVNKGISINNIAITEKFICEPFIAGFRWKNVCKGQTTQFYDTTYRGATAWSWNFGDPSSSSNTSTSKNPTHTYKDTGTYTVKLVASKTGAKDSISYKIKINAVPTAAITTKDTTICLGEAVQLSTSATVGSFYWSPGENLSDSLAQQPWAYPTKTTSFVLKVTNTSGCSATDTVKVAIDTSSKCKKFTGISGVINKYSKVSKIDTCEYYLTLDNSADFKAGDKALLIQMKGAVIDTSNTSDFGKILDYKSAGKYEYVTIESISGSKAYVKYKFINTYDVNSAVQLVSIPVYKNVYVVGRLTAPAWDGDKGGIVIFEATDTAYLNGIIDVSGKGFRGGKTSLGSANCHKSDYYYDNTSGDGAEKGEGIAVTKAKFSRGMGANANGGGGGNANNAGGGGGANASAGGAGGKETDNCSGTILSVGGKGGYNLSVSGYSNNGSNYPRAFMGGGGGAGHSDDGTGTDGGNGGGIIIVNANKIITNNNLITGNGSGPKSITGADGAGGGGGAGSVTFYSKNPVTSKNTNLYLNGGDGGSTAGKTCTGPGGGGSAGAFINYSVYMFNVSTFKWSFASGAAGINNNSSSACYNSSYGAASGTYATNSWGFAFNAPESKTLFGNIVKPIITVCAGDSVTLSATGGVKYIWSPSNLMKDTTKHTIKAKLDKATKFTVKIYNAAGCYRTDTITVAPRPSPALPAVNLQCVSVVDNNTIKLTWQSNFKSGDSLYFGRYTIYRKKIWESSMSVYDTVSNIHADTYTDTKANRNDTAIYVYQIRTTTSCGRNGGASLEIADIQLTAKRNNDREYTFSWNKPYLTYTKSYVLEVDAGSGYKTITTTNATQYTYGNCNMNATFRIAIKDTTKKCTTYSTVTKKLLLKDASKPNAPAVINASVIAYDKIEVTLRRSDSLDLKQYILYRSENGGSYSSLATFAGSVIGLSYLYTDNSSVSADKNTYCYKLVAIDTCGNTSDTSASHCTVNLTAKSGNLRTFLTWNAYKGYKTTDKQVVQRYNAPAKKWDDIASSSGGTAVKYTDSVNVDCNKQYAYRLATYESSGNSQISYSDSVSVTSYDSIAPPKVPLLGVSVLSQSSIKIDFKRTGANDVNYYKIYYSKNGGAFSLLTSIPGPGPTNEKYEHKSIDPSKDTFCYYIVANDTCSGLSSTSDTHCAMELKAKGGNFTADLKWSPYSGFTVQKYYIEKQDNSGNWKVIDSTSNTKYTHVGVGCDKWSFYRISAKEKGGNKYTSISDTAAVYPFDTIAPAEVNMLTVSVVDKNTVEVSFAKNADKDVEKYEIYVSENGGSFNKIGTVTKPSGTKVTYTHSNSATINTENNIYCYQVFAVDSCKSNTSKTSETHCTVKLQATAGNNKATLKWSKYIGFGSVKAYIVQRKNASGWTTLNSVTDTNYVDYMLTCNVEQTYRVTAEENGGDAQKSNSNTIKVTPFDNIKPNAPAIQYVTVNNGFPYIKWTKSTSNDVRNYEVYRKNASGTYVSIAKLGDVDTFTDVSANTQTQSYCYKIMAVDSCAKNQSALSAEHCDVWLQTSTKGCEKSVYLNWSAYSGWTSTEKVEIYRTVDGSTEILLTMLSASATSYKDTLLNFHKTYCYRIKTYEQNGNNSESWSNPSCKQTFFVDTAHIYTASKIVTSATAGKTVIKWRSEKGKKHLSHHRLYYATSVSGSFTLLADNIPVSKDSFVHSGINTRTGEHYYYLVTVDSCGTESEPSSTHKPIDLEVNIGQLIHNINWTKYEGFDVKGYYVQRLSGGVFNNIDTVSAADTFVRVFPAPCNFNIFYRIGAIDNEGRIAYSDTMGRTAIDTIFANAARLHNLTVTSGNSTDFTFRGSDSVDVYAYTIQRSEDGSWGTAGQVLFSTPGDTHLYADKINTQPKQLCYTIITLDSCLNATMSADTFCAVQLKGQELNLENALAWHGFKGYEIDKYSVLKFNGSGWDTLATTTGDTNHLHTPLSCNVPVTYKIAAKEKGGNRITLSDSITLVPFDTVKPAQPIMYYATVLDEQSIYVEWEKSEPDVKKYELSVGTLNSSFQIHDTIENALNYTFGGLKTMDSTYSFRIRAIDSCSENTSIHSEIHSTIQLDGQPQNLANALNWSAYKGFDVSKYYVYIYANGWKLLDSTEATVQKFTHAPLACNVPQWYKILAKDVAGKYTTWSDSIQLIPFDTLPPAKPIVHFATVEANRTIKLSWNWDTASDVKYFEVWRSTNGGAYSNISTVVYDSVYTDASVTPQAINYAYYVIAIDSCNIANRSQAADAHKIVNLKLATGACLPEIRLDWTSYVDLERGVDGYDIFRMANTESSYTKIATVSTTQTDYKDANVSLGVTYFYKIRAFDNETVYESYSDTSGLEPYQFPVPQPSKMVYASVKRTGTTQGSISVEWEKYFVAGDTFARGYKLYHRVNNGAFSLLHKANDLDETAYTHTGINTSSDLHEYYVTVFNLCDIEGDSNAIFRPANLEVENKNLEAVVKWHPFEGESVSKYELYKSRNNATPKLIGTFAATDTTYTDLDLRCDNDYTYSLRAYLANGKISHADTVKIKAFDTIPPARPDLYYVSVDTTHATAGKISMIWKGNNEPNRAGYRIYRSVNGGPMNLHVIYLNTTPGDIFWEDKNLNTVNNYYSYSIAAIDSCTGNQSMPSDTHQTVFLKTTAVSEYMQLNWQAYKGFKNYKFAVEKKEPNKPWRVLDTLDATVTSYKDSDVVCHVFYNYRIRSVDDTSIWVSLSNQSGDTAFEHVLPAAPVIKFVTVTNTGVTDGKVLVSWQPSASKDAMNYTLYRSEDGFNWQTVVSAHTALFYEDLVLNTAGKSYIYRLTATDTCGNVSDVYSTPHKTILLSATSGNSENILAWSTYQGWNVKEYHIYRDGQKYFSVPGTQTTVSDTGVICTKKYGYYVLAVSDLDTTLISASNIDSAQPYDTKAPRALYLKTATVSMPNKEVTLEWDASSNFDTRMYYIYKRSGVDGKISLLDSTTALTYTEIQDSITVSDCYFVHAVDYCNNVSEKSNRACLMILDGRSFTEFHTLSWNAYEVWRDGVKNYRIYKKEDDLNWTEIGFSSNTEFTDNFVNDTVSSHCYQVEAVENEGTHNAVSLSTTICLHQNPVVFIPNAFSPTMSEGDNDVFGPKGINMRNYKMQIFNRWGQLVYETTEGKPWDGKFGGEPVIEGVYMYVISVDAYNSNGGKRLKGTVTIIR